MSCPRHTGRRLLYRHLPLPESLLPLGLDGCRRIRQTHGRLGKSRLQRLGLESRAPGVLLQRLPNRIVDRLKHRLFVGKLDLQLGRVNVDIHPCGIQTDIHNTHGVLFGRQVRDESLLQRRLRRAGLDIAMVDKKALPVAIGAHIVRPPYESAYLDSFKLSCQRDQPGGKIPP